MKNLNFNRKSSILRNMDEQPTARKKINWDKIIYFVIMGLIAFFIVRYFINRVFYVHADGQMLFNSVNVRLPDDITIHTFHINEGDTVKVGDTLFTYSSARDENNYNAQAYAPQEVKAQSNPWQQREIYQLNKNINLNILRIQENKNLIKFYESEISNLETQVILEVSSKSKLEQYQKDLEKLLIENKKYQNEIYMYRTMVNDLGGVVTTNSNETITTSNFVPSTGEGAGYLFMKRVYISPINGVTTRIYKDPHEVAFASEGILNIHQQKKVFIKTFFLFEDLESINIGDKVTLIFPNGTQSHGIIKRFYSATYQLPNEFQKKYESTTRSIAADIVPENEEQLAEWQKFYKISVKIKKIRFEWLSNLIETK